eukprot:m.143971 g.143971  ORF g.143971 m.143971 type:complete len:76 (-) comp14109_c0_seq5:1046-1273(-)
MDIHINNIESLGLTHVNGLTSVKCLANIICQLLQQRADHVLCQVAIVHNEHLWWSLVSRSLRFPSPPVHAQLSNQ